MGCVLFCKCQIHRLVARMGGCQSVRVKGALKGMPRSGCINRRLKGRSRTSEHVSCVSGIRSAYPEPGCGEGAGGRPQLGCRGGTLVHFQSLIPNVFLILDLIIVFVLRTPMEKDMIPRRLSRSSRRCGADLIPQNPLYHASLIF